MSIYLLSNPTRHIHSICDDHESFLWTILFCIIRFRHLVTSNVADLEEIFAIVFDQHSDSFQGLTLEEPGKLYFLLDRIYLLNRASLKKRLPSHLSRLIDELKALFSPLYYRGSRYPDDEAIKDITADKIDKIIGRALDSLRWPTENDGSRDLLNGSHKPEVQQVKKRTAQAAELISCSSGKKKVRLSSAPTTLA